MDRTTLHERLSVVAGDRSFRELGRLTATNPETVRRYMRGQAPSVEFIAGLCAATGTNAHWVLTGEGAARWEEARTHALRGARAGELLSAVAGTIEELRERVDRLERYSQSLETRLRVVEGEEDADGQGSDSAGARVAAIAGAVAERAPEDAD